MAHSSRLAREKRWQANKPRGCKARIAARAAVAAVALAVATPALALPPPGTDLSSPEHAWWECVSGMSGDGQSIICCHVGDGYVLSDEDWRMNQDSNEYQFRINKRWYSVSPGAVINPKTLEAKCGQEPDPAKRTMAKVWYSPVRNDKNEIIGISDMSPFCFIPGTLY